MMKEGLNNYLSPEVAQPHLPKEKNVEKEFQAYLTKHPEKTVEGAALEFRLEKTQEKIKAEFAKELKKGFWEKLTEKKPKLAKFVNLLKTIMGGTAVNLAVRSVLMSLSAGVLPASILGGVASGAGVAYFSKRGEILEKEFDAEKIIQELDLESVLAKLTDRAQVSDKDLTQKISSVRGLFQYKKLFLQKQRVFGKKEKLIDALTNMEKELETRRAIEVIEKIPEKEYSKERIAQELIKLEENRLYGSDLTAGQLEMSDVANEFINSKKAQAGHEGRKAAIIGGLFGGAVSGLMTWATMPASGFGADHLNHEAALNAAQQNPDFQKVVEMAKNGASVGEVKQTLYQFGIDPLYKPEGSEFNVWQNIVGTLKTNSSLDAGKAVYNMLSYPDQLISGSGSTIDHFNQWITKAIHVNLLSNLATTDKGLLGIAGASKTGLAASLSGSMAGLTGLISKIRAAIPRTPSGPKKTPTPKEEPVSPPVSKETARKSAEEEFEFVPFREEKSKAKVTPAPTPPPPEPNPKLDSLKEKFVEPPLPLSFQEKISKAFNKSNGSNWEYKFKESHLSYQRVSVPDLAIMYEWQDYKEVTLKPDPGGVSVLIEEGTEQYIVPLRGLSLFYSPKLFRNFFDVPEEGSGTIEKIIRPAKVRYNESRQKCEILEKGLAIFKGQTEPEKIPKSEIPLDPKEALPKVETKSVKEKVIQIFNEALKKGDWEVKLKDNKISYARCILKDLGDLLYNVDYKHLEIRDDPYSVIIRMTGENGLDYVMPLPRQKYNSSLKTFINILFNRPDNDSDEIVELISPAIIKFHPNAPSEIIKRGVVRYEPYKPRS